ncbi:MAG: xanthine dehydrogenase accessory protein XdhC [Rhodospirillales bacterium]|nr:xanthine dehydrogenase accessory protein XdhC [Rhodospirillales bacterium]
MSNSPTAVLSHHLGPNDWVEQARVTCRQGAKAVLVFVARHYGSTPRDKGSWMLVRPDASVGTLGGGEVERVVEAAARDMLAARRPWTRVYEKFLLGPDMGQCCGGGMEVVFEPIDPPAMAWLDRAEQCLGQNNPGFVVIAWNKPEQAPTVNTAPLPDNMNAASGVHIQSLIDQRPSLVIYGSGHVARAFAAIAAQLPIRVTIVDDRRNELDLVPLAANVSTVYMAYPLAHAEALDSANQAVLVMTYSHALDYCLCLALLRNPDLAYIGLIGSKSKAARFRRRFEQDDGLSAAEIGRLVSPIGQGRISGKEPGLIALASLNEIMTELQRPLARQQPQMSENN